MRATRSADSGVPTDRFLDLAKAGELPLGFHACTLAQLRPLVATNEQRRAMWHKLICFLTWPVLSRKFSFLYLAGGYGSGKEHPFDIDVVLQTREPYGPASLRAIEPYFAAGLEAIEGVFSVHLHFWMEQAPPGVTDFRHYFQHRRPDCPDACRSLPEKGVFCISLEDAAIREDLKREMALVQDGWALKNGPGPS